MARSHNIYVVFDEFDVLIGCFTVKYEMVSWIGRHAADYDVQNWTVQRRPDNPGYGVGWQLPVEMPIKELLA
jgi:hypothetical protein